MVDRETKRVLPVLLGSEQNHIMAQVTIAETPEQTTVTIVAAGGGGRYLGEFLTADAPVAISIAGIPVQPRQKTKE